jgi:caa(3)-type oxidase subunit IV
MSEIIPAHDEHDQAHQPGTATYLIIAAFLLVLTAMEVTVFYVHALRPVLVPVLIVLAAAKFALVAMFYMHLKYDGWLLSGVFVFPLLIATVLLLSLVGLFGYLSHHRASIIKLHAPGIGAPARMSSSTAPSSWMS